MMRQAIITKYLGPTDAIGSRVKAKSYADQMTIRWDHSLNPEQNHTRAMEALLDKMWWTGKYIGGSLPDNSGYAFVEVE